MVNSDIQHRIDNIKKQILAINTRQNINRSSWQTYNYVTPVSVQAFVKLKVKFVSNTGLDYILQVYFIDDKGGSQIINDPGEDTYSVESYLDTISGYIFVISTQPGQIIIL